MFVLDKYICVGGHMCWSKDILELFLLSPMWIAWNIHKWSGLAASTPACLSHLAALHDFTVWFKLLSVKQVQPLPQTEQWLWTTLNYFYLLRTHCPSYYESNAAEQWTWTVRKPTITLIYHAESVVWIRVHACCDVSYKSWPVCSDNNPQRQCPKMLSHRSKTLQFLCILYSYCAPHLNWLPVVCLG